MKTIELKFPQSIALNEEILDKMISLNPALFLRLEDSCLFISEGELLFSNMDFFKLWLPFKMREEDLYQLSKLNNDLKLEGEEELIIINMGTAFFIGTFTAAILITIGIWNRRMKLGRVADSSTGHDIQTKDGKKHRIPDISFIAYSKFTSKVIDMNYRAGSPTLCIEVVSNKDSLNQDLEKMEQDWMVGDTDIGLVVCPHRKKYYLFEREKAGYKVVSFSTPFCHNLLPELVLDFDSLLNEAIEEAKFSNSNKTFFF